MGICFQHQGQQHLPQLNNACCCQFTCQSRKGGIFSFNSILWDQPPKLEDIILKIRYSHLVISKAFSVTFNLRTNNRCWTDMPKSLGSKEWKDTWRHQWRTYFGMATHCKSLHTAPMTCKLPDGGLLIGNHLEKNSAYFSMNCKSMFYSIYTWRQYVTRVEQKL